MSSVCDKIAPLNWRELMPPHWKSECQEENIIVLPVKKSSDDVKTVQTILSGLEQKKMSLEGRPQMVLIERRNIQKNERYDEVILQQMLVDDRIPMTERKRLSNYFRHSRISPSNATVHYERSKNLADINMGRFYPVGVGLQSFRWDIRGPLTAKYYWDIDFENCHSHLALKFAKEYGTAHTALQEYCDRRDECLKLVSDDRGRAKTAFLKVLYGGDITLYREEFEDNAGVSKPEGDEFLKRLEIETRALAEFMWNRYAPLHKTKSGKENKAIEKRPNKHAVLMSLVLQTEESKCLMALDQFFTSIGRTVGLLIHDGATIEKEAGELEFPPSLLKEASMAVYQMTGYKLRLTNKPIKNTYEAPRASPNEYATMKRDFERNNFIVGATLHCISSDGFREQYTLSDASHIKFAHLQINVMDEKTLKLVKKPFIPEWVKDAERRYYERIDFIPNRRDCPETVYNLFTGFAVEEEQREELADNGPILDAERDALIAPFLLHCSVLCGGDATYFLRWLAQLFQFPAVKSNVGLLFRDMGGLLHEGGGTGKNVMADFVGSLMGDKYYLTVNDNSTLYADFNSLFEGKLLVFIEEADGKDNHKNNDKLKSKITQKTTTINKKNQAQYVVANHTRYMGASNGRNPIPTRDGQTRWAFWDVATTYRGDRAYFQTLVKATKDRRSRVAFYEYLMRLDTWQTPIEFSINVPITKAFVDMRQMNAPPILKWLCYELRNGTLPEESGTKELFQRFTQWYELGNRDRAFVLPTENIFGRLMKEAYVCDDEPTMDSMALSLRRHTQYGTTHRFDFKRLIEGLEERRLLIKGECGLDDNGCLIQFDV